MKIILFSRRQLSHTAAEICQLFDALRLFGFDYAVNEEFAPLIGELTGMQIPPEKVYGQCIGQQPADSLMVCYGGDGTLLEGVHRLCGAPIPVMGINAGHLGFLTSAPSAGLNLIFEEVAAGRLTTEPRSMIEATGDYAEQPDTELGLLAQRRRPRRSPDMRLPGDFPPGSAQPHDAPRSHPRLGHDHAPCRRAALRRIRHPRQPCVRHRAGSGLHDKTRRSEDFSGRTAQYIIL